MQKISNLCVSFLSLILISCGSFQGPGEFQGPGDFAQPGDSDDYFTRRGNPQGNAYDYQNPGVFKLDWPVVGIKISQKFRPPKNPRHAGIDLRGPKNAPIYAAHNGVIVYIGRSYKGYGRMIILEHSRAWATLYAHLNKYNVKQGQIVRQGDVIGYMGRSGRASGVHLHFEVMKDKQPIDPLPMLRRSNSFAKIKTEAPKITVRDIGSIGNGKD